MTAAAHLAHLFRHGDPLPGQQDLTGFKCLFAAFNTSHRGRSDLVTLPS